MKQSGAEHACVFGLGWGDEGKGKVVDLLCPAYDIVVRFNGGANAGHTVHVGEERFALHLLPTGALHAHVTPVIGPGVVVDPALLVSEIEGLAARGRDVLGRLKVSERAHIVLPYHKLEDQLLEESAGEGVRIGTTARGIGPCYADKMHRTSAARFCDLADENVWIPHVRRIVQERAASLQDRFRKDVKLDADAIVAELRAAADRLRPCITDTTHFLHDRMASGKRVLFEGANGILLDVDHGTYPFVTSSSTGPYGIGGGAGVPPWPVTRRIGTTKAYATRVGSGPFVTELKDETGDRIREAGREFGTTTGRPRRCGWFDAAACAYSARLGGATDIALMHLDTLSGFEKVDLCVGYKLDGKPIAGMPAVAATLERIEPVVEFMPGWRENLREVQRFEQLPPPAKAYIERIEALVGVPITMVGVGPDRSQMLVRGAIGKLIRTSRRALECAGNPQSQTE